MEGFPKIKKENNLEKPKIKEGVDFVFEKNPEFMQIGTKEQYSEYLDTIFPNSKVKNILYHGGIDGILKFVNPFEHENNIHSTLQFNKKRYGIYFSSDFKESQAYADTYKNINKDSRVYPVILDMENPHKGKDIIFYGAAVLKNIAKFINKKYKNFQDLTESDYLSLKNEGIDGIEWIGKKQYIVFDNNQIYKLGFKQDLENFKKFVENSINSQS